VGVATPIFAPAKTEVCEIEDRDAMIRTECVVLIEQRFEKFKG